MLLPRDQFCQERTRPFDARRAFTLASTALAGSVALVPGRLATMTLAACSKAGRSFEAVSTTGGSGAGPSDSFAVRWSCVDSAPGH